LDDGMWRFTYHYAKSCTVEIIAPPLGERSLTYV
jgi:hypothetical protein